MPARFATGDAFGHGLDQYLGAGTESLRNVALIAAGREDEVTMWSPPPWTAYSWASLRPCCLCWPRSRWRSSSVSYRDQLAIVVARSIDTVVGVWLRASNSPKEVQ